MEASSARKTEELDGSEMEMAGKEKVVNDIRIELAGS
jgi:hypothetical protein